MFPIRWKQSVPLLVLLWMLAPLGSPKAQDASLIREVFALIGQEGRVPSPRSPLQVLMAGLEQGSAQSSRFQYSFLEFPRRLWLATATRSTLIPLVKLESRKDLEEVLEQVWRFGVDSGLGDTDAFTSELIQGALSVWDPQAHLYSRAALSAKGHGAGERGLIMDLREGELRVAAVLPESSAESAGLLVGDHVLSIGGYRTHHLAPERAASLLTAAGDASVRLTISRADVPRPIGVILRPARVHSSSVQSRLLHSSLGRIGYLCLQSFDEDTHAELLRHLDGFRPGRPGLLGVVLDLRNNPGGLLEQSLRVANVFLNRGVIATLSGGSRPEEVVRARWMKSEPEVPLVVLVDRVTASAAELVAGALKTNRRAVLIGEPTYGKHTIQALFNLSNGQGLKLTVAEFLPGGEPLPEGGVMPHLRLVSMASAPTKGGTGPSSFSLFWSAPTPPAEQPVAELPWNPEKNASAGNDPVDYPLELAVRLFESEPGLEHSRMVRALLNLARQEAPRQAAKIPGNFTPGKKVGRMEPVSSEDTILHFRIKPESAMTAMILGTLPSDKEAAALTVSP